MYEPVWRFPRSTDDCLKALAESPDGTRLAYAQEGNLYIHDLAASETVTLAVLPVDAGWVAPWALSPAWSPRGGWVVCGLESLDYL